MNEPDEEGRNSSGTKARIVVMTENRIGRQTRRMPRSAAWSARALSFSSSE